MLETVFANLVPWLQQSILMMTAGALLPLTFRIRHPRTLLTYCHAMLVLAVLLPLVEPWRHPVISVNEAAQAASSRVASPPAVRGQAADQSIQIRSADDARPAATDAPSLPAFAAPGPAWTPSRAVEALFAILVAGAVIRLFFLLGGLAKTRKHRIAAMPLYPIPPAVEAACAITHTQSVFCISTDVHGPVMLGWLAPVVLLPESFMGLDEEAQCGIACHELLHVRRQDWLVTVLEEIAGCLLWFNPAAWYLLAQTNLAREQFVDAETVRLTAAREPYLEALLAIARERPVADLAPATAPLFLRRHHLTQRMDLLLHEVSSSRIRLCGSYAAMAAILAIAGWLSFVAFPLTGNPRIERVRLEAARVMAPPAPAETAASAPQPLAALNSQGKPAVIASLPEVTEAPVPPDPREPAVVPPQITATPENRAAVLTLLDRARANSEIRPARGAPYRLDISFTVSGASGNSGSGTLTEIWLSGRSWRWTAALGSYSQTQLGAGGITYTDHHVPTPMMVHALRNALFAPVLPLAQGAVIRTASIVWNGQPATCVLNSRVKDARTAQANRLWEEIEYCIDNASGLLQVASIAPGEYSVFSYGRNIMFHGRAIPDRLTIYSGASGVLDAQVSIADPGVADASQFQPSPGMLPGTVLTGPERFKIMSAGAPASSIRPVIVQAEVGVDGHILEEQVLTASDPSLAQAALDAVRNNPLNALGTQRQIFVNVQFVPHPENAR